MPQTRRQLMFLEIFICTTALQVVLLKKEFWFPQKTIVPNLYTIAF